MVAVPRSESCCAIAAGISQRHVWLRAVSSAHFVIAAALCCVVLTQLSWATTLCVVWLARGRGLRTNP
eukprot:7378359-Prymnesium_polylepis.1